MDNTDTCRTKKMDANKVWQWRIMHVKKYSRRPDPFYFSSRIGLDFNVASSAQKKLDLQLVTNGVILEICNFAKIVNKSKRHFLTNILENNFDLGFENEQQRIDFSAHIHYKVKELIRKPPKDKNEVFTLFDTPSKAERNSNYGLTTASSEHLVEMDETDHSEHEDEFKFSQATSEEYLQTEGLSVEMGIAPGDDTEHEYEFKYSKGQSAEELQEDCLPTLFPYCEGIGLNLDIGSKQSLDPDLLTKGVMLELVHFTRILTASYSPIVLDVLEHNFELDLKSQQGKSQLWLKISHLLRRRNRLLATGTKISLNFKDEQFSFQTNPLKRAKFSTLSSVEASQYHLKDVMERRQSDLKGKQKKRALSRSSERANKRHRIEQFEDMETNSLSYHTDLCTSEKVEGDHCHTFSLGESDQDSDKVTDPRYTGKLDHLQSPKSCSLNFDIAGDSEPSYLGFCTPLFTTTEISSSSSTVNSNVSPTFASQPDERGLYGGEEPTQTPRNTSNKHDMEQDEMGTEIMWKLRANHVKQILSSPQTEKEYCQFTMSKKAGLEFNVGFGPKKNISVDSLSNAVLLEVAKFALAMNSSLQDFIMEILEYNFDFGLQSQHQRNLFTCEIMKRVRKLRICEDAVKFSKEVFELPGSMLSIHMPSQSMGSVNPELSIESRMEECDVAPVCSSDSHTESKEHISEMIVDPHPFCKEIGLKLHVNNREQNTKLDINKLTNGAMTEVTNFAEQLCGTFEQICLDILRHNFDFDSDLQSGDAKSIVTAVREKMTLLSQLPKHLKVKGTNAANLNQDCQNDQTLDASGTRSPQVAVMNDSTEYLEELDLMLWKLRANQVQQILSIPHGEHCPLYSYPRCKTVGIDFSVGSGVKQNLDPKLLTNGIVAEVDSFANALHSAEKYFITEILEYNFHLDFKSELHRSVFTQQIWQKISLLKKLKSSIPRMNMPFELPDVQELTPSDRLEYCPKCYQDRNDKLHQDESDPSEMHHPHPHIMLDTVSADANCIEQKPAKDPSLPSSATEEAIMDHYPRCKKIGLNLCVNKDQPKDKLDMHVLTIGILVEVASFAKKLCGSKIKTMLAIIENNFNIRLQPVDIWNKAWLSKEIRKYGGHAWLDEVFVLQPQRQPKHLSKLVEASTTQISERKETIKKRMLALQTKEERPTLPSPNTSVVKSKTHQQSKKHYPYCTEIGLDLDVTSKSGKKEKLDLNLLTRAVMCEIHKFAVKNPGNYMSHTVFDILDYNFDLSSQHYRRWEFSIATTFKVQAMVKQRAMNRNSPHEVFKLPFVFAPKTHNEKPKKHSRKESDKKKRSDVDLRNVVETNEVAGSCEDTEFSGDPWSALPMCGSPVSEGCDSPLQGNIQIGEEEYDAHFGNLNPELDTETAVPMSGSLESEACDGPVQGNIQTKEEKYDPQYGNVKPELDTGTIVQMSGSLVSVGCGSPPPGNAQIKEEYNPHHSNMKPEPDTEEKHIDDVKRKSNTEGTQHLVPDVATGLLGYMPVVVFPNFVGPQAGLQNQCVQCYILAEPQGTAIRPDIVSNITPRLNTEGVQYLFPVQAVGCPIVTIGPGNESTLIRQEQENVPADLQQGEVHRK